MSETKLLPCPFCGGEATIRTIDAHTHILKLSPLLPDCIGETFVECKNCTCAMSGQTESETIKAWNTRKPIERIVERLDELDDLTLEQYNKSQAGTYEHDFADGKSAGLELAVDIVKEEGGFE